MKYALSNKDRIEATPKAQGICQCCGSELVAKCGTQKIWHWAHKGKRNCDHWWENETQWHRDWKDNFPKEWQEVVHQPENGEKHIADVKTPNGLVVEFQHSAISAEEKLSLETLYKNMIWVVDGRRLERDFKRFNENFRTSDWRHWGPFVRKNRIPSRSLPKSWQSSSKLVFFDWGFVKSEYWIKDWHSHLICLLPEPDELGWLQLIAVEREQFTKIVGNISSMDTNSFFW
jgi:competence protein CoiA